MIAEIFENLFEPISNDEQAERFDEIMPDVAEFEKRIMSAALHSSEQYSIYAEFNEKVRARIRWNALHMVFAGKGRGALDPFTRKVLNHYLEWKKRNDERRRL